MTAERVRHHLKERRRKRERDLSRQDILAAAERVFSAEGFDSATMEAIAEAAGFSVGSLYNFFSSKADLCRNVIENILAAMLAQLDPLTAADGAAAVLRTFVRIRVQDMERHRGFFKMMAAGGIGGGKGDGAVPIHALFARFHQALIDRLAALIGTLPRDDDAEADDPVTVALAIDGFVLAACRYWSHQAPRARLCDKLPMIERMALRIAGVSGIKLQDCEADRL
jgi:AcrR family transcriptional regulator